jgi:hypothetical protein
MQSILRGQLQQHAPISREKKIPKETRRQVTLQTGINVDQARRKNEEESRKTELP